MKTLDEFMSELTSFGIKYLIDVRSNPFSKWAPQYDQNALKLYIEKQGIVYVYMGDVIGGRPMDDSCYDEEGYFDYQKMALVPAFKTGILRLVRANEQHLNVAVMCSESNPSECHRSKLIGRELYAQYDIEMKHIVDNQKYIPEQQILIKLTEERWRPEGNLFGKTEIPYFKSVHSYKEPVQEEYYD